MGIVGNDDGGKGVGGSVGSDGRDIGGRGIGGRSSGGSGGGDVGDVGGVGGDGGSIVVVEESMSALFQITKWSEKESDFLWNSEKANYICIYII